MASPHAEAVDDLLKRIGADPAKGLSSDDARKRLEKDGKNELPPPPRPSAIKRFFGQFANPIVMTLLAAAAIALYEAHNRVHEPALVRYGDAIAILLIVALNAVLGFTKSNARKPRSTRSRKCRRRTPKFVATTK